MRNHIIVILDHSGSMSEPFSQQASGRAVRGLSASHAVKIDEAKAQLISWLETSDYDKASIVPFSNEADEPLTVSLPSEMAKVRSYLGHFDADGGTHLAAALEVALGIGTLEPEGIFVRYLIVTDGLSQTQSMDIDLLSRLPATQGIDGLLINPTDEGEMHLRRLCIRGRYIPIYGPPDLQAELAQQQADYEERTTLTERYELAFSNVQEVIPQLRQLQARAAEDRSLGEPLRREISQAYAKLAQARESYHTFSQKLADAWISTDQLEGEMADLERVSMQAKELVEALSEYYGGKADFAVSLSYPRRLSKGYSSVVLVQVFLSGQRLAVKKRIESVFGAASVQETTVDSSLTEGMTVEIGISSPELDCSEPVVKTISKTGAEVAFWAKPKDTCKPGNQSGLLQIRDAKTRVLYDSVPFQMRIVDYAFDHVSRPWLANIASFVVGLGSLLTFVLTLFGQIDTAFGLTSGTAGGAIAVFLYTRVSILYRQRGITQTNP